MTSRSSTPISSLASLSEQSLDLLTKLVVTPARLESMAQTTVGQTPYTVIYEENKLQLRHYEPLTEDVREIPIVFVYSLINKPAILDLQPDRSVIRRFLEHGFDVYLIDWGEPSRLDTSLTIDDYIHRYLDNCVDVVRDRCDVDSVTIFGYCMGGTMSAIYAALHPENVHTLVLLAAGLDFAEERGILTRWSAEDYFDETDIPKTFGNVPAEFLDLGFVVMEPIANTVTKYLHFYDRFDDEEFVELFTRMERWLRDGVDMAGATYSEFVNDVYQHNQLAANDMVLQGPDTHVDVQSIDMPVLQIVGSNDHLVPPTASKPFNDLISSSDTDLFELESGHVGLAMSSQAHEELWPRVCEWVAKRSGDLFSDHDATR